MILGLCCVKDCERWFEDVLATHLKICDRILVLDDGSTDRTGEIARSFSCVDVWRREGLPRNEARDRNFIFDKAHALRPDWCFWFDGDETVHRAEPRLFDRLPSQVNCLVTPLLMMWRDAHHYAHDWSIEKRHIFRYLPHVCRGYRWTGTGPHQIHCGARPRTEEYQRDEHVLRTGAVAELHWGWMDPPLIDRKLARYREWDPRFEDFVPYRRFERPPRNVRPLAGWDGSVGRPS